MAEELYLRLFHELNESRFDSAEAEDALVQLGPPALLFRAFAHLRRRTYTQARADLDRALDDADGLTPLLTWLAGAAAFGARDYDRALALLGQAAASAPPDDRVGVARRARKLALKLSTSLGWSQEARLLREAIASQDIRGAKHLRAHTLELQRQSGIRRRAQEAQSGPPERAAHRAYSLLFHDGPEAATAALDSLAKRHPDNPAIVGAQLRLDLLLDRLEAADDRVAALAPELAAELRAERASLALAWGDANAAIELTQDPGDDPRLLYVRALAVRNLFHDFEQAADLLDEARALIPNSIAIYLGLAVIRHQHAPKRFDEDIEHRFAQLLEWAPGLLSDAAASVGVELWTDRGTVFEREAIAKILFRAHGMLTFEHDLELATYARRGADGQLHLRHVAPPSATAESHLQRLHASDDELTSQHEAVLVWSIGVQPPQPEHEGAKAEVIEEPDQPWTPSYLSPEQIEQFLVDGFLVIPRAFDPEFARTWRELGLERMTHEPEKWVRGYDPDDPSRSIPNFSRDDPSTWTMARLDLLGPESVVVEEFAPNAWAAICDLLGGPARIQTREWSNYLLLNLSDDDLLAADRPGPHASSWHIDDPNPVTRIDSIRNGLVCIALFDKLLPKSGNTWLAPDSVARVAQELAAHPEGVDFVNERGRHITGQCQRFFECTGEAGDILLMHPLMMHSASPNRSKRIRWMANPMVYLREPLNPFRPVAELSPVELAIHRAIQTVADRAAGTATQAV